jgi:UDP-N-acetylmuramoylalanine--D-glutamate ligase
MIESIQNMKVVVLGAARSGLAAAKLLKAKGASVYVSDIAPVQKMKEAKNYLEGLGVPFEFGVHSEQVYVSEMVVLSPGIPPSSDIVQSFKARNIPVFSELEVASWYCNAAIIAVTGSNGKTTTTTILGEMLKTTYKDTVVAGNIGSPLSLYVKDDLSTPWAAVEVSSFQLETTDSFHPKIVMLLNLSPNHLDWYDSYDSYIDAKMRILNNLDQNDFVIYNSDDDVLSKRISGSTASLLNFSLTDQTTNGYIKDSTLILNDKSVIETHDISIRGQHNYANALAAGLAAQLAGIPETGIAKVLRQFRGVPHRLELVATISGVQLINDSKATTLESLAAALHSFDQKIILIAGGKDKGADFDTIRELLVQKVRHVILVGQASRKMYASWHHSVPIERATSLDEAVLLALEQANDGDYIVFSPACSSFDMFKDYEHRGDSFKNIVNNLKRKYETQ